MKMKKLLAILFMVSVFFIFLLMQKEVQTFAWSDQDNAKLQSLTQQIANLQGLLQSKQTDYQKAQQQLSDIKVKLTYLEGQIAQKELEVKQGEAALVYQKNLLNERVKSYYKNITTSSVSLMDFLIGENLSSVLQNFFYQKTVSDDDKNTIIKIVLYINDLEAKKASLESEKTQMVILKQETDQLAQALSTVISNTQQQIAQLSALQQQLIAQKLASLNLPRSAYTSLSGCVDDRDKDPGFSPRLAFFTYGVPNRIGLNQYGAWGRAKDGESAEQILQDYYPGLTLKKDYDTNANINVDGYGSYNVEEYVKRIYEMPDSWTDHGNAALMAQAVAARSYGLAHRGGICTTDSCQVFKPDPKGGNWNTSVESTKGWVLVDGSGNPASTQYSSTHGGYILDLNKFDGKGGNPTSFDDLKARAYDRDSPWFYCDWGARSQYSNTAWLKTDEVADIANVILLVQKDSGTAEHLFQPDKPNPAGTDTWDAGRVKQELQSRGVTPYSNVTDASVGVDFGSGRTTNVTVSGDAGSNTFNSSDFKNYFNLRAPANIQIVGPLFNSEKR